MSIPARRLDTPPPASPARRRSGTPAPRPRRAPSRPVVPATQRARRPARRVRRRSPAFIVFASAVVGSMVFGIVVLNVLLAQASFRIEAAERQIEELQSEHRELVREQATLSAPRRIAAWAARHGMRLPDDIRILHPSGAVSAGPAGADPLDASIPTQGPADEEP